MKKLEIEFEEGQVKLKGDKFTVAELIDTGQGLINLARGIQVDFNGDEKAE